jgi:hypothetical protein
MPRTYEITFEQVAVSAAQDLVSLKGASGKMVRVLRAWVNSTDTTLPTSQMLGLRCRLASATITLGSGGTDGVTPRPVDPGDAAASFTANTNDTTKATTSGSFTTVEENGCHVYQGYDKTFARPFLVGPNEGFVFELLSTVSGTVHLSGGVEAEEMGG